MIQICILCVLVFCKQVYYSWIKLNIIFIMQQSCIFQAKNYEMKCPGQNKALEICCSEKCSDIAFICLDDNCKCRKELHKDCDFKRLENFVNKIIAKKGKMPDSLHRSFSSVMKIYQEMISKLNDDMSELLLRMENYGLKENQLLFMTLIGEGQWGKIDGNFISKVKKQMNEKEDTFSALKQSETETFWKVKSKQFVCFCDSIKELTQLKYPVLDSKITSERSIIQYFLGRKVKSFNLLYRATENNFEVSQFHKLCDQKPHTLTLVQTQYDKIIGGYTPLYWKSNQTITYRNDQSSQSFLFSISNMEKYPLVNNRKAIRSYKLQGPVFGKGCDLAIRNHANIVNQSFSTFPTSYNNGKYIKNKNSYTSFCGSNNSSSFLIKQWEVFQIQFLN